LKDLLRLMIKLEKDLIEKHRLNKLEARLMTLSEEVSTKFKAKFKMLGISQIENQLKEFKLLKFKDQMSVPNMYLRAKIDNPLH
jgi:hypothetical protein